MRRLEADLDPGLGLAAICGPVAWGRGRWPDVDWIDGALVWVGRERDAVVGRVVRQDADGALLLEGSADAEGDEDWARTVLGLGRRPPDLADPVLARLAGDAPGLRPWSSGSLFEGLVTSIIGQSITVAVAAVVTTRVTALFHPGIEIAGRLFRPLPTPEQLAAADPAVLRPTGVTWRRAGALAAAGRAALEAGWPSDETARDDPDAVRPFLRRLPLVGPWTAESALLWGVGTPDVHPTNDAALLRAARLAYGSPDLDHRALDAMADDWRPHGGWAARLLWNALLGPAPVPDLENDRACRESPVRVASNARI